MLYHAFLPEKHQHYVPFKEIMEHGIKSTTHSNYVYGNGGSIDLETTEKLKPIKAPDWIDFTKTVRADIANQFSKSFCFPVFTDKILIFDGDISLSVYDQAFYDENKYTFEEALDFDTGETIEHWIKLYWDSMMTLEEYLIKRPYPKSEVLIFEPVPKDIIKICEE
ncbi:DNA polymerase III [Salipaludibacillus sp. LMS25]|jgi:hypothetical protein|uniref:DNA polymerase III n=1 Tax=Salipaludibacillus sp. LMS25 TaxID=2924031 RepID=UPI0034E94B4D